MKRIFFLIVVFFWAWWNWDLPQTETQSKDPASTCSLQSEKSVYSGDRSVSSERILEKGKVDSQLNPETLFANYRKHWRIASYHSVTHTTFENPLGKSIVYHFSQDSVPIIGMTIRVRVGLNGEVVEEENSYRPVSQTPIDGESLPSSMEAFQESNSRYIWTQNPNADSKVIVVREGLSQGELGIALQVTDKLRGERPTLLVLRASDGKLLKRSNSYSEF